MSLHPVGTTTHRTVTSYSMVNLANYLRTIPPSEIPPSLRRVPKICEERFPSFQDNNRSSTSVVSFIMRGGRKIVTKSPLLSRKKCLSKEEYDREATIERGFLEEVEILRRLSRIPEVVWLERGPYVKNAGSVCLDLEYLDGEVLTDWAIGNHNIIERLELAAHMARVVQAIHESGVIICDLKPQHVIVEKGNIPLFFDFNWSTTVGGFQDWYLASREKQYFGTDAYISPEVRRTREYTTYSDIYSAGFLVYAALTGADDPSEIMPLNAFPYLVHVSDILQPIIDQAMAVDLPTFKNWALKFLGLKRGSKVTRFKSAKKLANAISTAIGAVRERLLTRSLMPN